MQLLHQPRVGITLVHLFERLGLVNLQDSHGVQGGGCLARSAISFGRESGCQLTGLGRETRTVPPSGGVSWAQVHRDRSLHLGNARVPPGHSAVEGSEDGGGGRGASGRESYPILSFHKRKARSSLMRGTPLIAPLRQPGTKQRWKALWRSALFSSTRLQSKNLISGCTCHLFIPMCMGSGSGMQNPLANFIGVFSLVRDDRDFQVNPLCRHDITRSDRQIGNLSYVIRLRFASN